MKRITIICALIVPLFFIGMNTAHAQTLIEDWGDIGDRLLGGGWTIDNTESTPAGEVHISGTETPGNWTAVRGALADTVELAVDEALIVRGSFNINGPLEGWNPLRLGVYHHDDLGTLHYQHTDSAQWGYTQYEGTDSAAFVSNEAAAHGFLITNQTGANGGISGVGGNGNAWAVNGGSWISTFSGGSVTLGQTVQSPRRANMPAGDYDFEMSARPLEDGTTEFRWYISSADGETYLHSGVHTDTTAQKTEFNGFAFSMQNGIEDVTEISLSGVEYEVGSPITIPDPIFSPFYVSDWGDIGGRLAGSGWTLDNDTTTLVGDAYISGPESPGNWTAVRGGFGELTVTATEEEALIVRGLFDINGPLDGWNPLRLGVYNHTDAGQLNNQYTDSAAWGYIQDEGTDSAAFVSNEASAFGYLITNQTGANGGISGVGGNGNAWAVNGGSWISTFSGGSVTLGQTEQSPRRANMPAGEYEFEMSVQPQADGTTEFRWFILSEDGESYLHSGVHTDTSAQKTEFNGFAFAMQNGIEGITEINLYEVEVDRGEPITIPDPIFSPFYASDWGFLGGNFGGSSETDSSWNLTPGTLIGDVSIGGDAATGWANVGSNLGIDITPSATEALRITADVTFEGGGFAEEGSFRFGVFNGDFGSLDSTETVGYVYTGSDTVSGYVISPSATSGTISSVSDGSWYAGSSSISDQTVSGTADAGTYELTLAVWPDGSGGNNVAAKLEGESGFKYEVANVDASGTTSSFNSFAFGTNNSTTTGVTIEALYVELVDPSEISVSVDDVNSDLPSHFALNQNYPNPFNPTTNISFDLPKIADVQLEVYNMLGQKVMTLVNRRMEAGSHQINFDARNLASGMYVYRIEAGSFVSTKKMMLIK